MAPHAGKPAASAAPLPAGTDARAQAVSELFREHNRALVNFLLTKLHDEQEAKEAAQEAYVKLLQLDQPVAVSILRWTLFKIARCIAIDKQRQHIARTRLDRRDGPLSEELDLSSPVEDTVMAANELERLSTALEELPGKCRQAFVLHRFRGLSTTEVAQHMGLTDRMIRLYVKRALVYCRFRLEGASREEAQRHIQAQTDPGVA